MGVWHFFVGFSVAVAARSAMEASWRICAINMLAAVVITALCTSPELWGLR